MHPKGIPFTVADEIAYADGSVISKTIVDIQNTGSITLFSFDAGQGLSEHTSPFDAVVHIIDGRSTVTIGGQARVVNTGEMIIMPAGVPHALHAGERFKMMLIMLRGAPSTAEKTDTAATC